MCYKIYNKITKEYVGLADTHEEILDFIKWAYYDYCKKYDFNDTCNADLLVFAMKNYEIIME